jgi:hypothetical protein
MFNSTKGRAVENKHLGGGEGGARKGEEGRGWGRVWVSNICFGILLSFNMIYAEVLKIIL